MPGLKKNSLLALAFRPVKKRTYHSSFDIHGGYYQERTTAPSGQEAFSREYDDGYTEVILRQPVTLKMLGFKRLPSGRIVKQRKGGDK